MLLEPFWILQINQSGSVSDTIVIAQHRTEALEIARFVFRKVVGATYVVHDHFSVNYTNMYANFTVDAMKRQQVGFYNCTFKNATLSDYLASPFVMYLSRKEKINKLLK